MQDSRHKGFNNFIDVKIPNPKRLIFPLRRHHGYLFCINNSRVLSNCASLVITYFVVFFFRVFLFGFVEDLEDLEALEDLYSELPFFIESFRLSPGFFFLNSLRNVNQGFPICFFIYTHYIWR